MEAWGCTRRWRGRRAEVAHACRRLFPFAPSGLACMGGASSYQGLRPLLIPVAPPGLIEGRASLYQGLRPLLFRMPLRGSNAWGARNETRKNGCLIASRSSSFFNLPTSFLPRLTPPASSRAPLRVSREGTRGRGHASPCVRATREARCNRARPPAARAPRRGWR